MKKRTAWGMCAAWMAVIFWMSSMPGEVSGAQSSMLVRLLVRFLSAVLGHGMTEQLPLAAIELALRKAAHMAEYAVLGLLTAGAFIGRRTSILAGILVPWCIASVYAVTDEIHQLFVPGRSGQVSDVLLDSAGVLAGLLVLAGVRLLRQRQREAAGSVHVD